MSDNVTGIGWRFQMPRFDGRAACAEVDPELHFPEPGGSTADAKRVCSGCEIKDQCLAWAIRNDEWGIWGGTTEQERRGGRRRRMARPLPDINHGTSGGYRAHHRRGEKACQPCSEAEAVRNREQAAARARRDGAA